MCVSVCAAGDTNVSLRRSIVERILKLYHTTCRNLTVVNDNLTRAQGTIEVRGDASLSVWLFIGMNSIYRR